MRKLLFCLPQAGAGAGLFRRWKELGFNGLEVYPILLPGRESRMFEEPHTDVGSAVDAVLDEVRPLVGNGPPIVLFGHCLGAILGFELARRLRREGEHVERLIASGNPGPWTRRSRPVSEIKDDDEFLAALRRIAGYHDASMDDEEFRELMLPTLRADVRMQEGYLAETDARLDVPITAMRGAQDDVVSPGDIAEWRDATNGPYQAVEMPGGHMYFTDNASAIIEIAAGEPR